MDRAEAICAEIEALSGTPRTISPLPGGLTNTNVRVTTPQGSFVLRMEQSDPTTLGIDRDQEAHNTRAAEEAGVGSPFVAYRPDLKVLVVEYIESVTLTNAAFRERPELVPRVAAACRILHAGPRFAGDFDMFRRQAGYLKRLRDNGYAHPKDYADHLDDFARVQRALAVRPEPTKPCNNDTLAENFLDDGQKIWIIDYEYSGNNEPSFELGNIRTECDLLPEQGEELTLAYYGADPAYAGREREMIARVRLQALVARYGWSLWGYLQAATSPFDFDFTGWGDERFEKARSDFGSSDFPKWLETVSGA